MCKSNNPIKDILIKLIILIFISSCSIPKSNLEEDFRNNFIKCWASDENKYNLFEANLLIYKYGSKAFGFLDSIKCPIEKNLDYNTNIAIFRMNDKTSHFNLSVEQSEISPHFTLYGKFEKKYRIKAIGKIHDNWFNNQYYTISVYKIVSLNEIGLSEFEENVFLSAE